MPLGAEISCSLLLAETSKFMYKVYKKASTFGRLRPRPLATSLNYKNKRIYSYPNILTVWDTGHPKHYSKTFHNSTLCKVGPVPKMAPLYKIRLPTKRFF